MQTCDFQGWNMTLWQVDHWFVTSAKTWTKEHWITIQCTSVNMSGISNSLMYKSHLLSASPKTKIQHGQSAASASINETICFFHNSAANNGLKLWSRQRTKNRMDWNPKFSGSPLCWCITSALCVLLLISCSIIRQPQMMSSKHWTPIQSLFCGVHSQPGRAAPSL